METISKEVAVAAFNEWMRRYTEEPAKFAHEFEAVGKFLKQQSEGKEPDYGTECAELLFRLATPAPAKEAT